MGTGEGVADTFFSRESMFVWAIRSHLPCRRKLSDDMASRPHVRLRSGREVAAFLAGATAG